LQVVDILIVEAHCKNLDLMLQVVDKELLFIDLHQPTEGQNSFSRYLRKSIIVIQYLEHKPEQSVEHKN
jgi:hypothetical protein